MSIILKQENLWDIVEIQRSIISFPILIIRRLYTKTQLIEAKQRTQSKLTMSMANNLIGIISQYNNLTNT